MDRVIFRTMFPNQNNFTSSCIDKEANIRTTIKCRPLRSERLDSIAMSQQNRYLQPASTSHHMNVLRVQPRTLIIPSVIEKNMLVAAQFRSDDGCRIPNI